MTDLADVDWENPCERAKALKAAYFDRLAGGSSTRVRFRAGNNEQEYQSSHAGASLAELKRAWWEAEDECRALQGLPPLRRRVAIRGGSRRF